MGKPDGPRGPPSRASEKQTRGTETSQYPEEEKATAIPLVAASERGPAQTRGACTSGVVGPRHGSTTPIPIGPQRPPKHLYNPLRLPLHPLPLSQLTPDT